MRRALELAAHGLGNVSPNPMVGAVIVYKNTIIGEGYHRKCGEAHAEVNAIASVKPQDRPLLHDSTLFVTLEPCSHFGKTPPCADLIIKIGIPRVVVAMTDPFKEVSGRGIRKLRDAGIDVIVGMLEAEARQLNIRFITAHEQRRPFITLKWAQSADGFMDSKYTSPFRFSTPLSAMLMHRVRSLHDAILVGSQTFLNDKPQLSCRLWYGRSPKPFVVDRRGRIIDAPERFTILRDCPTVHDIARRIYDSGCTSVLVEGGATLLNSFIAADLWDIARIETSPHLLRSQGSSLAPSIPKCEASFSYNIPPNTITYLSKSGESALRIYKSVENVDK